MTHEAATEPAPISSELATEALNNHGFSVTFDEGACGLGAISGMLSNTSSGPTPREVMEREGTVVCFLFVRPRNDPGVPEVSGDSAHTPSADLRTSRVISMPAERRSTTRPLDSTRRLRR